MNETIQNLQVRSRDTDITILDSKETDTAIDIRVAIESVEDIVIARQEGRTLAKNLGFSSTDATLIATAISELARNIVLYANQGEIVMSKVMQGGRIGLVIIGKDSGPGIANVEHAMMNGYSTSGGLGLGLPGVKKLMDSFDIKSEQGQGTLVTTIMWLGS